MTTHEGRVGDGSLRDPLGFFPAHRTATTSPKPVVPLAMTFMSACVMFQKLVHEPTMQRQTKVDFNQEKRVYLMMS